MSSFEDDSNSIKSLKQQKDIKKDLNKIMIKKYEKTNSDIKSNSTKITNNINSKIKKNLKKWETNYF